MLKYLINSDVTIRCKSRSCIRYFTKMLAFETGYQHTAFCKISAI